MIQVCRTAVFAALLVSVPMKVAAEEAGEAPTPAITEQGGIPYVSGGIGAAESAAMKAQADRYALALTLVERVAGREVYLASVPVVIRDAAGATLLDVVSDGPYLLVNLPAGSYRVLARHKEVEKSASIKIVAGKNQRLAFVWQGEESQSKPTPSLSAAELQAYLPAASVKDGIPYLSGGIGLGESQAMKAEFPRHSLAITFANRVGKLNEYLASVPVSIWDANGAKVFELETDGPYLLVDLPAGTYRIVATHDGLEKQSAVRIVAGKHVETTFVWTNEANMPSSAPAAR